MVIKSNFHDYYDKMISYGQDKSIMYIRYEKTIDKIISTSRYRVYTYGYDSDFSFNSDCLDIYFCGKYYNGYKLKCIHYHSNKPNNDVTVWVYNKEHLDNFLSKLRKNEKDVFLHKKYDAIMDNISDNGKMIDNDIHVAYNSPIICTISNDNGIKTTINTPLRQFEFFKIIDAFTAYQEISMMIGGILCNKEKPIPVIPDILKAQSHGFDKYSFRKRPK